MTDPLVTATATTLELLTRVKAGDRDALQEVARQWWPAMRRWALLELRDPTLAEDACQEALIRLMRFGHRYDTDRSFRAWLHTVVRNCCRDVGARRTRIARREVRLDVEAPVPPRIERDLDLKRGAARALEAFDALSARQRQVFDLCDRQGMTPTEAAGLLDLAPGTVRATLFAARKALRQRLVRADRHARTILEER